MEEKYKPPFSINNKIIMLIAEISELIGHITSTAGLNNNPRLRRANRIKTIQASLSIENNTLTLEQVTALINGKRVLGRPSEIREVKNAYEVYEQLLCYNPFSVKDMLSAHKILMAGIVQNAGHFRSGGVGIFDGSRVVHMAPPAEFVPEHISNLLEWYQASDLHPLIKSAVFHYEFEFIHPFADGNGRMGRLWHTMLLSRWKEIMAWIPVETIVKERQEEYYKVLGIADKAADCTEFIEFMLTALRDTLLTGTVSDQDNDQVKKLLAAIGDKELSMNELMEVLGLKHKPTFRKNYLKPALEQGLIEMTVADKPNSRNQKYRKKS